SCDEGRCIPHDRYCEANDDCRQWCYEFYGVAAETICDGTYVPRCEADTCGGAQNRCSLLQACSTSDDCTNSWTIEHFCDEGRCVPSLRSCGSDMDCRDWCYEFYGAVAPTICDDAYVPRCD